MGKFLGAFLLVCQSAIAILPLPYPVDIEAFDVQSLAESERDPKTIPGLYDLYTGSRTREMELPTFGSQPRALGYSQLAFTVPPGLRKRVDFWKRIYTEFTTQQMVMHDTLYPEIVYGVVDISGILPDPSVPHRKRMREINKFLKEEKKKVAKNLELLQSLEKTPQQIPVDLFPVFRQFESIREPNKFKLASDRIRAQLGQRDKIVQGFFYGGRYFQSMMQIFEKRGVPKELTRLPLVESAFNLAARSKVGASGVWQFMRSTGKRYLRIDNAIDERNDPIAATWAAAELLSHNYQRLGSWPLAVTAYNHGAEGMLRATRELTTTDLAQIIANYKEKTFGFASSNFFSEFLAILEVEHDYRRYFGKLTVDSPLQYEEISLGTDVYLSDLADACRMPQHDLQVMNPAFSDQVIADKIPIPKGYAVKVLPAKIGDCRSGARNLSE